MIGKKHITIDDIAREAGVSLSTVSRVLNGSKLVAWEKRDAVLAAVEKLNYRPSIFAQGLARGKSSMIGILTQNLSSMFYSEIMKGIELQLIRNDYYPIFTTGNWRRDEEKRALDTLVARRVDGVILLGGTLDDELLYKLSKEMPVVAVGRTIRGLESQCIRVANFEGAYKATKHLIDLGHTSIATITGDLEGVDSAERHRGFSTALHDAGLSVNPQLVVKGNFQEKSGLEAIEQIISRDIPFSAIFVANDQMAYGVYLGLFHHKIRIPEDVSVVGFDDQPVSVYIPPPLTTMRQPCIEMGSVAADAVITLLEGNQAEIPIFDTELIVRESTTRFRPAGTR